MMWSQYSRLGIKTDLHMALELRLNVCVFDLHPAVILSITLDSYSILCYVPRANHEAEHEAYTTAISSGPKQHGLNVPSFE